MMRLSILMMRLCGFPYVVLGGRVTVPFMLMFLLLRMILLVIALIMLCALCVGIGGLLVLMVGELLVVSVGLCLCRWVVLWCRSRFEGRCRMLCGVLRSCD